MGTLQSKLTIYWDGINPTDESSYLISASGSFTFSSPATFLVSGGGTVDGASFQLANRDNRYIPKLDLLALFQRNIELDIDQGAGYNRIFTGIIQSAQLSAPNASNVSILTLKCYTRDGLYLQRKYDLTLADFRYLHDSNSNERGFIDLLRVRMNNPAVQWSVDAGLMYIPWLWMDDESVLEECWKIAAACGGIFYTSRTGVLTYRNASSFAKAILTESETLSRAAGSYASATMDLNQDNLYSDVVVEVSTRHIAQLEQVWTPDEYDDLSIPPGGTLVINATFNDPVYQMGSFEWEAITNYGAPFASNVTLAVENFAQKVRLTFTNTHASIAALIPYFRINAYPVVGRVTFERISSSTKTLWNNMERRTRSVRQNAYIQTPVQGKFLADIILAESDSPRPLVTLNGIPGKGTRFIGQVVRVQDSRLRTADIVGQIQAMQWQLGQTFEQSIVVQDFGDMYNCKPYFVLDTDTIGSSVRIFY